MARASKVNASGGSTGEVGAASPSRGGVAGKAWMQRLRMRMLAVVVGMVLAGFGVATAFTLPVLPVLGVAIAAAAVVVNQAAHRLIHPTCYGCGRDIASLNAGMYGVECPDCGVITQVRPRASRRDVA